MNVSQSEERPWSWLLLILFVALGGTFGVREILLWTETSPRFSEKEFRNVALGTRVSDVFDKLGDPLEFVVLSIREGGSWDRTIGWNTPMVFSNFEEADRYLSNGNYRVVFDYSRARRKGASFRVRQFVISNGQVIKIESGNYWDF